MNNNNRLFTLFLLLLAFPLALQAQVVTLTGKDFPQLLGKQNGLYSFFAMKEGRLAPVPHQWVEWSEQGYPFFEEDGSTDRMGDPRRIDAEDRLLLRFEDGGPSLSGQTTESVVAQLAVTHGEQTRLFYLVKNAYLQNTDRYIQFDPSTMTIKSTDFALTMADNNLFKWNNFYFRGFEGENGQRQSILDTLKLRLSAGVFGENNRVTLNNNNLDPKVKQIINGPLAAMVYASTSVKVARVPVLKIHNYFLIMPQQVEIHSRFTLPGIADTVLERPALDISLDGNGLYDSKLVTSWTGNHVAITDGTLSESEKTMLTMPLAGDNWIWFGTGRGFDLLAQLAFVKGFNTPVRLLYQDDANLVNEPERFPGQLPNVGFSLTDIPFGQEFYFVTRLFYSKDSNGLPPGKYAQQTITATSASLQMQ
ncbi:MAG: hypothetical protein MI751_14660 [Pseudomonadales bacterium]|nr:hypothetical protein [Pseudomonadales bacterium]|tara:strand:+ start:741 stop:2003 length:1263 start_codon:yes stop_codon:yes gene_type:complete